MKNIKKKKVEHSLLAKSLHWVFVVMFGYGVFKQIQSKEQLNDAGLLKTEVLFALIFLAFIVFRFIYMKKNIKPRFLQRHPPYIVLPQNLSIYRCTFLSLELQFQAWG